MVLVMKCVEVEHRAQQHDEREDDDNASYHAVDEHDAAVVEFVAHLVDKPCQPEPPQQGTAHDAQIAHAHVQWMFGHDKGKLCKRCHEEQDDERVGECHQKGGDAVVYQRALLGVAHMYFFCGVRPVAIHAEDHEHDASRNLQPESVLRIVDQVHHKTHAQPRDDGIDEIADGGAHSGDESIPASLVQGALYAENAHGTHWRRCHDADEYALTYIIEYV